MFKCLTLSCVEYIYTWNDEIGDYNCEASPYDLQFKRKDISETKLLDEYCELNISELIFKDITIFNTNGCLSTSSINIFGNNEIPLFINLIKNYMDSRK